MNFLLILRIFIEKDCPNNIHKKILTFNRERQSQYFNLNLNSFDKKLYSTYLSFLKLKNVYFLSKVTLIKEVISLFVKSPLIGQVSGFYSNLNISRGNHFHHTVERFLILSGKAKFNFKHSLEMNLKKLLPMINLVLLKLFQDGFILFIM